MHTAVLADPADYPAPNSRCLAGPADSLDDIGAGVLCAVPLGGDAVAMHGFLAFYEGAAKIRVAAKANGWTDEEDGSELDYADADAPKVRTGRRFKSEARAKKWLRAQIAAWKTAFGCGEIVEVEPLDYHSRSR